MGQIYQSLCIAKQIQSNLSMTESMYRNQQVKENGIQFCHCCNHQLAFHLFWYVLQHRAQHAQFVYLPSAPIRAFSGKWKHTWQHSRWKE